MSTTWQPPSWDDLNFARSCELYGSWLSAYATPDKWHQEDGLLLGVNFGQSLELFLSALSPSYPRPPSYAYIAQWWVDVYMVGFNSTPCYQAAFANLPFNAECQSWNNNMATLQQNLFAKPSTVCPKQTCKAYARTGNPDLAGIGVFAAYLIQATLVTFFFMAFVVGSSFGEPKDRRWKWRSSDSSSSNMKPPSSMTDRVIDASRYSIKTFQNSSFFLCLAVLIAAIYTDAMSKKERDEEKRTKIYISVLSNFYDTKLSLLSSTFSILPFTILHLLGGHGKLRLRWCMLSVLYILCVTIVFLAPKSEWDYGLQSIVKIACDKRGGSTYWQGLTALQVLVVLIPALWAFFSLFVLKLDQTKKFRVTKWLGDHESVWPIISGVACLIAMWTLLAFLTELRADIIRTAEGIDDSNEWGFGQVLAFSVWLPVVLEFFYHLLCGQEKASEENDPSAYELVDESKSQDNSNQKESA